MSLRLYFVTFTGAGTVAAPFVPVARLGSLIDGCDGRVDPTELAGECAFLLDTTAGQHATMLATPGVTYAPFENASGVPRQPSDALSTVSAANRATLKTMLEARSIPIDDFAATTTCREVWRRVEVRMLIRQTLGPDDLSDGLDTLISAISPLRRQRIAGVLQAAGYDTTGMAAGTVRQAIALLANQFIASSRTAGV